MPPWPALRSTRTPPSICSRLLGLHTSRIATECGWSFAPYADGAANRQTVDRVERGARLESHPRIELEATATEIAEIAGAPNERQPECLAVQR